MAPIPNERVFFNSAIQGAGLLPEPGKTILYDASQTIDLDTVSLDGGFIIKTLDLSVDVLLSSRISWGAFPKGSSLTSHGVGIVVRSEHAEVKVGDHIYGMLEHQRYTLKKDLSSLAIIRNPHNLPWSAFIGPCGMPGQTAFFGWKEHAHPKKGDIVFVSSGASSVGSLVIQLAKLDGLKVIASAGSDEKVEFMKEIGADVAFNYKTTSVAEVLKQEGPIDIYWDNVGGETLEAALEAANTWGRFIECGMSSGYTKGGVPVKNLFNVISKSLTLSGFVIIYLEEKYGAEFSATIPALVASGKIKYQEEVSDGLDKVEDMLVAILKGTNKAKAVIHVGDE